MRVKYTMKVCSTCKTEKSLDDFSNKKSAKDGKNSSCKECTRATVRRHYENNKEYYLDKNERVKNDNRERVWKFLKENPCMDCGEQDPLLLEFDHLSDKTNNVSTMVCSTTWPIIQKEIDKCEVVCANCHRKRTYQRANTWFYQKWLEENIMPGSILTDK